MKHLFSFLCFIMIICTLISAVNAILRKFFGYSSNAYLEMQWILYSCVFLLAAPYLLQTNGHIRIDILYQNFSERFKHTLNIIIYAVFLVPFLLLIFYFSLDFWLASFMPFAPQEQWFHYLIFDRQYYELSPNAGGLPTILGKSFLPLGIFLLMIQMISEIIKSLYCLYGDYDD